MMFGAHAVKHWSSTQPGVALSSGEAEYVGVVRGAGQGLGFQALLHDMGLEVPLRIWTDSSAAMGIAGRQGLGKLRHLDTHTLWVQQAVRTGRFELRKVPGEQNPADLLTKHSQTAERLAKLVELFGAEFRGGRAAAAPQLRKSQGTKTTMADGGLDGGEALAMSGEGEHGDDPIMPHLVMEPEKLDQLYPAMRVSEEDPFMEPDQDAKDSVLQSGLDQAAQIQASTQRCGRTRYEGMVRVVLPVSTASASASGSATSSATATTTTTRRPSTTTTCTTSCSLAACVSSSLAARTRSTRARA